mmetsp:Transcript_87813/g.253242  ORF Transcript_87813/g.253242 Transcript_87813/m.253242 type:complete len:331 (+) Transcript_87813:64-1056(+)
MSFLVWRATFTDVDDELVSRATPGGMRWRRRSQSEPRWRKLAEATALFSSEQTYVAKLRAKFECGPDALPRQDSTPGALSGPREPGSSPCRRTGVAKPLDVKPRTDDADAWDATLDAETHAPSSEASSGELAGLAQIDIQAGSILPSPNAGSLGHPALCSRPCLYFPAGQCANGESCEYCHMAHTQRSPHLNKRHRDQFRNLGGVAARALIMPLVKEKALALDASDETALAVDRLARECGAEEPAFVPMPREGSSLRAALRGMNLTALLLILRRSLSPDANEASILVEALLARVRCAVKGGPFAHDIRMFRARDIPARSTRTFGGLARRP